MSDDLKSFSSVSKCSYFFAILFLFYFNAYMASLVLNSLPNTNFCVSANAVYSADSTLLKKTKATVT